MGKILKIFFYSIFCYREKVVINNLQNSFLHKNQKEIITIKNLFYNHFFSIIMEIIKMISADKLFFKNRISYKNIDLLDDFARKNQSIIMVLGHTNNWEWALASISIVAKQKVLGVYKKINNKFFETIILKARKRFGAELVSMEESMRVILSKKKECLIIGLIADQTPTLSPNNYWATFFNQETPVYLGPEKI